MKNSNRSIRILLGVIALLLGANVFFMAGEASAVRRANAAGIPDSGAQFLSMIDQLKELNAKVAKMDNFLESGALQVKVKDAKAEKESLAARGFIVQDSGTLMFGLFDKDAYPIGIDVGTHSVRLLQFRRKGEQLALQAAARVDLGGGTDDVTGRLSKGITAGLSSSRFVGKRAVMSLPPAAVHAKSVRLPQMPDTDLSQALQWEAKDRFGFEIGDGRIVWFRAGEIRRGTEIKDELLLFAVQGAALTDHLDAAGAAGLMIEAIDLAACAMERGASGHGGLSKGGEASAESTALLDVGHSGSEFIITRNGQLVFYKHIDIGARAIDDAVAQKLGITCVEAGQMRARLGVAHDSGGVEDDSAPLGQALQDAMRPVLEGLVKEIDMCLRYYVVTFRGARPNLIRLTGRQATCPWLLGSLGAGLGLPVEAAQPLRGVHDLGAVARPDRSSEWAVAAGLSLYRAQAGRMEAAA